MALDPGRFWTPESLKAEQSKQTGMSFQTSSYAKAWGLLAISETRFRHSCFVGNREETIQALLRARRDGWSASDEHDGLRGIDIAYQQGHRHVVEWLLEVTAVG